jgi:hypothetical protein
MAHPSLRKWRLSFQKLRSNYLESMNLQLLDPRYFYLLFFLKKFWDDGANLTPVIPEIAQQLSGI